MKTMRCLIAATVFLCVAASAFGVDMSSLPPDVQVRQYLREIAEATKNNDNAKIAEICEKMLALPSSAVDSGIRFYYAKSLAAIGRKVQAKKELEAFLKTPGADPELIDQALALADKLGKKELSEMSMQEVAKLIRRYENEAQTSASGLKYVVLQEGDGAKPSPGQAVAIRHTGYLMDGKEFDSSGDRGSLSFRVGKGEVIKGWDEAMGDMRVGEKRAIIVPANLAYGSRGVPGIIPPNATLFFEVERTK